MQEFDETMTGIEQISRLALEMTRHFTAASFYKVAKNRGFHIAVCSKALIKLEKNGFLRKTGACPPANGIGGFLVVYEVIPEMKDKFKPMRATPGKGHIKQAAKDETSEIERNWRKVFNHPTMIACNRLDAAMSGWR